jgi:serine protease Do
MRQTILLLTAFAALVAPRPAVSQTPASEPGWIGVDAGIVLGPGVRPVMIVRQIAAGSPAADAGLGPGDTLVALDGMVPSPERFRAIRAALRPGDPLELTVKAGGTSRTLLVRAGRRPRVVEPPAFVSAPSAGSMTPWLVGQDWVAGAQLAALNAGLAQYFGTQRGLLVIEVAPGTPAEAARLLPGDVLLQVGGVAVNELPALRRAVAAARPDQALPVVVVRRGREVVIALPR